MPIPDRACSVNSSKCPFRVVGVSGFRVACRLMSALLAAYIFSFRIRSANAPPCILRMGSWVWSLSLGLWRFRALGRHWAPEFISGFVNIR